MTISMALGALLGSACSKHRDNEAAAPPAPVKAPEPVAAKEPAPPPAASGQVDVGVKAGGIQHDAKTGPAGVITSVKGTVEVRRVGETAYAAAKANEQVYPGDTVRTADGAIATITLADQSVVEVAETTTVAVASRDGSADPGSSAAVLAGIARFSVTPRVPGEGAFRVYTPSGVIVTKGTTYGVGVAASGQARVGVETGAVDVIGLAALDAPPVAVSAGNSATLEATGSVSAPAAWPADDWGTWRDDADTKVDVKSAIDAHGAALATLDQQLADGYAKLQADADADATFEASAAAAADKGDTAAYQASLPDGAATIDASFSLAGRLEALTWADAAHATLASELYVRHPETEASFTVLAPRVDHAVLWPKRYQVTATAFLEPLRMQYYVHEPRGRVHAALVGVAVPAFYAKVEPPVIAPAQIRAKAKTAIWIAPELSYKVAARPVWVMAPAASWHASVHAAPAPARAKVAWYVRPPAAKATVLVGGAVKGTWTSKLAIEPAEPVDAVRAYWKVPVGVKIKLAEPDLAAAASARARVKLAADGRLEVRDHRAGAEAEVRDHRAGAEVEVRDHREAGAAAAGAVAGKVEGKVGGAITVKTPDVKAGVDVQVRDHRGDAAKAGGEVRDHRAAGGAAAGEVKTKVDGAVKAGASADVKIKAPEVKLKGEASGGIKIGN